MLTKNLWRFSQSTARFSNITIRKTPEPAQHQKTASIPQKTESAGCQNRLSFLK
jgi:hypothetical protein